MRRGLAESRTKAQALILAGGVRVDGRPAEKSSQTVPEEAHVEVETGPRYVSRGGEKLNGALARFGVSVAGRICLDVGASTGGFTDCLLQRGAAKVYALDVGKGLLDWRLRRDRRVCVLEEVNIRRWRGRLEPPPDLAAVDVSFISLEKVLPSVLGLLARPADILALVKPQFEAPRGSARKGVVRDEKVRREATEKIARFAAGLGLSEAGRCDSPIPGREGNRETFLWLRVPPFGKI